jgi:hypothetical protein
MVSDVVWYVLFVAHAVAAASAAAIRVTGSHVLGCVAGERVGLSELSRRGTAKWIALRTADLDRRGLFRVSVIVGLRQQCQHQASTIGLCDRSAMWGRNRQTLSKQHPHHTDDSLSIQHTPLYAYLLNDILHQ